MKELFPKIKQKSLEKKGNTLKNFTKTLYYLKHNYEGLPSNKIPSILYRRIHLKI